MTVRTDLQVLLQALKVKANGLLVEVPVLLDLQARVTEDGGMVTPRGSGQVDDFGIRIVASKEGTTNAECTSTRDGLGHGDAVFGESSRVLTIGELESGLGEVGDTSDASVLLVKGRVDDLLLGLADRGENVGLALVVAVSTDTCTCQCVNMRR